MTFRDLGRSVSNRVFESVGRTASTIQESRPLPSDVLESDDAYLVVFDAPGATQSDVQVRYTDGAVEVRIDRFREFYTDFEMRVPGRGLTLDGSASLPDDAVVDPSGASATLRANGTLEVQIPKTEREDQPGTASDRGDETNETPDLDASDDTVAIEPDDDA